MGISFKKAKKLRNKVMRGGKTTSKEEALLNRPNGLYYPQHNWIFNPIRYRPKMMMKFINIGEDGR